MQKLDLVAHFNDRRVDPDHMYRICRVVNELIENHNKLIEESNATRDELESLKRDCLSRSSVIKALDANDSTDEDYSMDDPMLHYRKQCPQLIDYNHPSLIAIEGGRCAGISSLATSIRDRLENCRKVLILREPCEAEIRSLIRSRLGSDAEIDKQTVIVTCAMERRLRMVEAVKKMQEGYVVICDRYRISNYVHYGMDMSDEERRWMHELDRGLPVPDVSVFLATPISTVKERARSLGKGNLASDDYLDKELANFSRYKDWLQPIRGDVDLARLTHHMSRYIIAPELR